MPSAEPRHDFSLLETMRLQDSHIVRRHGHLSRVAAAARANGFAWDDSRVTATLDAASASRPAGRWRVRLLLPASGEPTVECTAFPAASEQPWRIGFAVDPVDEDDPFLRIKTSRRQVYDDARAARPGLDDVVLWTRGGEVTESTIANVVVELDGALYTPPSTSPLLCGVFREELLQSGRIAERPILKAEAASAPRVWLVNSLREWIETEWT